MGNFSDVQGTATSPNPNQDVLRSGSTSETKYFFTRIGEQIHFLPTPVVGDIVELIYHQDVPEMRFDNDQPYSLLIAPDVLLYLALRHASIFLRDNEQ